MENKKQRAAIVCCSNGQSKQQKEKLRNLQQIMMELGIECVWSDYIYEDKQGESATAKQRAESLMNFYRDDEIRYIFDISGGDLANEILPFLDYDVIAKSEKQFWGYSDLTCVMNAIYAKCQKASVLYQIRNLLYRDSEMQKQRFENTVLQNGEELFDISYEFLQGNEMTGVLVGGNIRCLLKLAGTPYWPDMTGKVLLLEAYSGNASRMTAYLSQLEQMNVFEQVNGVLLGTFTELEKTPGMCSINELILAHVPKRLTVAFTKEIGHGTDSKALCIGKPATFCRNP